LRKCSNITPGGVVDLLASGTCNKLQRLLVSAQLGSALPQEIYVNAYWHCVLEIRKQRTHAKGATSSHSYAEVTVHYKQRG
jgi:hypothetical protein